MKRRRGEFDDAREAQVPGILAPTPSNCWRVFCAIDLSALVRERLMKHISLLREEVPQSRASWSRESNIHLTVKFFGDTEQSRISDLTKAVSRAVKGMAPFKIVVEQTGAFPKLGAPRVLWIGITDKSEGLTVLKRHLEDQCAKVGFVKEERPFHPHLTIARLHGPRDSGTLAATHKKMRFEPAEVVVSELCVMRSELRSDGAKYSVLSRHLLESSHGEHI